MLQQHLSLYAHTQPNNIALQGQDFSLSYAELQRAVVTLQSTLQAITHNAPVAIAIENHPAWVVLDLALTANALPVVPIPAFFSPTQVQHALQDAGVKILITDQASDLMPLLAKQIDAENTLVVAGKTLTLFYLNIPAKALPPNTAKVTYTSGTTGNPKGVCLSLEAMLQVANSIQLATQLSAQDQHLCVLPLATLLENVAGVYANLLTGACVHLLPAAQIGFTGSSLNIHQLHDALTKTHANTAILIPEMLNALVQFCETTTKPLPDLRFLAVGGASVSPQLLQRAVTLGLPVFEGYGLSESASVVALNTPSANKIGSVGKPLPHVMVQITQNNEVLVKGANLLAYTGEQTMSTSLDFIDTGDIGYLDDAGYLYINGRKKNIFITSFGRNVSPEWVERELKDSALIAQAALFGEAKPWNVAVIVLRQAISAAQIQTTIHQINAHLPDYARIHRYLLADEPFSVQNQQLTTSGKNRRDIIFNHYQDKINALYHPQAQPFGELA